MAKFETIECPRCGSDVYCDEYDDALDMCDHCASICDDDYIHVCDDPGVRSCDCEDYPCCGH